MSKRKAKPTRLLAQPISAVRGIEAKGNGWRPWLLAGLTAIHVARPLLGSETTHAQGDGLPFVMAILVLAVVWLLLELRSGECQVRIGWADAAWAALLLCYAASTMLAIRDGAARLAINALWEWVGMGVTFFLVRQLLRSKSETTALVMTMMALAFTLACFGLYQYFISMPETRAHYKDNKVDTLRELGIPPNSVEQQLYEKRLESTEPTATFALANSLAALLSTWLTMALGLWLFGPQPEQAPENPHRKAASPSWGPALSLVAFLLPLAACLLLTKSRGGYLATFAGLIGLAILARERGQSISWRLGAAAMAILAAVAAVGVGSGVLDREVFSEAFKSLEYRAQYWKAALAMIHDHMLLGVGPANFQDYYPLYKLAEASEEVSDPHNFLLEVWATAGSFAAIALVGIFVGAMHDIRARTISDADRERDPSPEDQGAPGFVWMGGAAGFLFAFVAGWISTIPLSKEALAWGLVAFFCVWLLTRSWDPDLPRELSLLGAAVLAVNLLVATGIGHASVAGSMWLLLAVGLWLSHGNDVRYRPGRWAMGLAVAAVAAWILSCHLTAYRPVIESKTALLRAANIGARGDKLLHEKLLHEAAKADPWSEEPWVQMAFGYFEKWRKNRSSAMLDAWEQANARALAGRPHLSAARQQSGKWYFEVYEVTGQDRFLTESILAFERAVELYPNQATGRALLALAYQAHGDHDYAVNEAKQAWVLDARTPHDDQKILPRKLADRLAKLVPRP